MFIYCQTSLMLDLFRSGCLCHWQQDQFIIGEDISNQFYFLNMYSVVSIVSRTL